MSVIEKIGETPGELPRALTAASPGKPVFLNVRELCAPTPWAYLELREGLLVVRWVGGEFRVRRPE